MRIQAYWRGGACKQERAFRGTVIFKRRQLFLSSLPTFLFLFRCFKFHCSLLLNYDFLLHFALNLDFFWDNNFLLSDFLHCPGFYLLHIVSRNVTSFLGRQTSEGKSPCKLSMWVSLLPKSFEVGGFNVGVGG